MVIGLARLGTRPLTEVLPEYLWRTTIRLTFVRAPYMLLLYALKAPSFL